MRHLRIAIGWPLLFAITCLLSVSPALTCAQEAKTEPPADSARRLPKGFSEKVATANGVKISFKSGGTGPAVVLLHGYAQTSDMWIPLLDALGKSHTVIAPDLRGIGNSERTPSGYDKKTLAKDIRELVRGLGHEQPVAVVGHDIGLMVAYAYAAQYPNEVSKVVLMDAFLPGIGDWKSVWLMRDLWHFHFQGEVPLALVKGRERIYFEHFWNDFAADKTKSIPEADRQRYAAAYARDDGMRAGFELFKNFELDAKDFAAFSETKLRMPVLVLTGEKASGSGLIDQTRLVASNVKGVIVKGSGHWLMEEAPDQVMPAIVAFVSDQANEDALRRLTPDDIRGVRPIEAGTGTSGVSGIRTRVLVGDPTKAGVYTIELQVPANTRIEAHEHPDDRVATVVSGTWYFGYGTRFDEKGLKALPAGSFYTEPPRQAHFAQTGDTPVVVHITGVGPSGTRYSEVKKALPGK
jgi:pimeloyl-ACP methyl ester carboxylesterase